MPGPSVPFGAPMRHAHFAFAPTYTPLNHGSYGAHPVSVRAAHLALRAEAEAAPDPFIALGFADRLAGERARAAALLHCAAVNDLVFTPNATTALGTVLMNVAWAPGDVVLCYEVLYDSVAKALAYLVETRGIEVEVVHLPLPVADDALVDAMVAAARRVNHTAPEGGGRRRRVRLAVCDTIISGPGARVPFERLVPALQAEGALVLVDGAHGIGHIELDLAALGADFFVTNLHKWLFVPRGCAALVVRRDRQDMIRTTLPTSHGFRPREPLWPAGENGHHGGNAFVDMFDFTGTADMTHWLCVEAALQFRNEVCGGEDAIQAYTQSIARRGGDLAAAVLGTDVMDCAGSSMRQCNFANVRMPLTMGSEDDDEKNPRPGVIPRAHGHLVSDWIKVRGCEESGIYFQTFPYYGSWWWRLSGMVYVEEADFRRGAEALKKLCERVERGEYLGDEPPPAPAPAPEVRRHADETDWDSDDADSTPASTPTSCDFPFI